MLTLNIIKVIFFSQDIFSITKHILINLMSLKNVFTQRLLYSIFFGENIEIGVKTSYKKNCTHIQFSQIPTFTPNFI